MVFWELDNIEHLVSIQLNFRLKPFLTKEKVILAIPSGVK